MTSWPRDNHPHSRPIVFRDASVLDCTGREPYRADVRVTEGSIVEVGPDLRLPSDNGGAVDVDAAGRTLMPGLIDAHVHLGCIGRDGDHGTDEWSSYVIGVVNAISGLLAEGFTCARDAGGLEPSFARAVRRGEIVGPTLFPSGSQLTHTGGHGDARAPYQAHARVVSIPGLLAANEIVDGPRAMRQMAREQLRRGATQIKVFASGGVIQMPGAKNERAVSTVEFTVDEMAAAVEVARDQGTYVMAHCQTPEATSRAIDAGVSSIEHGALLDEQAIARIAEAGASLIPTLSIYESVEGLEESPDLDHIRSRYRESVRMAVAAGIRVGSGSDCWGGQHPLRGRELLYKAAVIGAEAAILSATAVNARILGIDSRVGTIRPGLIADLILVDGNPLDDISALSSPDRIVGIFQGGRIAKLDTERLSVSRA